MRILVSLCCLLAACAPEAPPPTEADAVRVTKAPTEICYGIALKGRNDGTAALGTDGAGTTSVDFQGNGWTTVPAGECGKYGASDEAPYALPGGRKGSTTPLTRDIPKRIGG
jgi:uncharacterized membrane protein